MQSRQIKAAPPGGLKMEIDQVCSRETQTPSTAVLLQWCYDLCNWMIKVANLFGTLFLAVAQLYVWLLTRHWCAVLRRFITAVCIFRRNVSLGTFCWHRRLSICTMVQCPPSHFSSLWFTTSHSNVHQLWNLCLFCTWNEQRSYLCSYLEISIYSGLCVLCAQAGEMALCVIEIFLSKKTHTWFYTLCNTLLFGEPVSQIT